MQFRGTAKVQVLRYLAPDESDRRSQAFQRTVGLGIISIQGDENLRRARVLRQYHAGYANQPNARIAQLALHDGFNLFPQGLAQALPMIFGATLLHSHLLSKTDENIRKMAVSGTAQLSCCACNLAQVIVPFQEQPARHQGPDGQP